MDTSRVGGNLVLRSLARGRVSELPETFSLLQPPQLRHRGLPPDLAHLRRLQPRPLVRTILLLPLILRPLGKSEKEPQVQVMGRRHAGKLHANTSERTAVSHRQHRNKKKKDNVASGLAQNWQALAPASVPLPASSRKARSARAMATTFNFDFVDDEDSRDLARRTTSNNSSTPRSNSVCRYNSVPPCAHA